MITAAHVIETIRAAFAGVDREGVPSWSIAYASDHFFESHYAGLAQRDCDTCWEDLLTIEWWREECWTGDWAFFSPKAFRYYLPAAMIFCIEDDAETLIDMLEGDHFAEPLAYLSDPQRSALIQYIVYWIERYASGDASDQSHIPTCELVRAKLSP